MASSPAAAIDASTALAAVRRDLALANRILARQGVVDTFGHVSQRSPLRPDRVLIARSIAPERVTAADIVELDLDGKPVEPGAPDSYIERYIHTEVYRARPDVHAVVHSHSVSVLPFTVVREAPLRGLCHTAGFLGHEVPLFDVRDVADEDTDLLVRNPQLGVALAECLGTQALVLMRGHGSTTVGQSLRQAVFRAVYAEINAQVQLKSMQLGAVTYLSAGEARVVTATDAAYDRAWDLWTTQVARDLPD
jgi:HCOMODA/2-hydroxy-3-carboxy-muconic semialdehyde decarboxylase